MMHKGYRSLCRIKMEEWSGCIGKEDIAEWNADMYNKRQKKRGASE